MSYEANGSAAPKIGPAVRLRGIEEGDLDFLVALANDPVVRANVVGWDWPLTKAGQLKWFASTLGDNSTRRFIVEDSNGTPVGVTIVGDIDWRNGTASLAIKLGGPEMPRRKGLGTAALYSTMQFAFEDAGLRKLHATILDTNEASKALFTRKCGWKQEGLLRRQVWRGGDYVDLLQVGIFRDEFENLEAAGFFR